VLVLRGRDLAELLLIQILILVQILKLVLGLIL